MRLDKVLPTKMEVAIIEDVHLALYWVGHHAEFVIQFDKMDATCR